MFKRGYQANDEFKIDLPFVINQDRALSEKEFRICLPDLSYEEYFKVFLKRRITDLFQQYKDEPWFKNRYLKKEKRNLTILEDLSNIIIARNVNCDQKINEYLSTFSGIKTFIASQNSKTENFSVDLYIIPKTISMSEAILNFLKDAGYLDAQIHDLSKISYRKKIYCTFYQVKNLFSLFCYLCNFDESSILKEFKGSESVSKYIEILQKKFNFDPVSCKQYDSNISLSDYLNNSESSNDTCERSLDILSYSNVFKTIFTKDQNCENFYSETLEKNFKCIKCEKIFENKEFITHHIQKKHQNFWNDLTSDNSEMNCFLENIDCFFLRMCLGIEDSSIPLFFKNNFVRSSVVYDIPNIFSGQL